VAEIGLASGNGFTYCKTDMPPSPPPVDLDPLRRHVLETLRALRAERGWTQRRVATALGTSQSRLSVVERGEGSISAEQLLTAMQLFGVPAERFRPAGVTRAGVMARARALLGSPDAVGAPSVEQRADAAQALLVEVLLAPRKGTHLQVLAPLLVRNLDLIALPRVYERLEQRGRGARLGWLADAVAAAIQSLSTPLPGAWGPLARHAEVALYAFSTQLQDARDRSERSRLLVEDVLETGLSSAVELEALRRENGVEAKAWGIVTGCGVAGFAKALQVEARRQSSPPPLDPSSG
jgi:transcriptional regulator with XRE-family HTH domain